MIESRPPRWLVSMYRALVRRAPARIRDRFADDQVDLFVTLWREERPAPLLARVRWITVVFLRAAAAVLGMHLDNRHSHRGSIGWHPLAGIGGDVRLALRQYRAQPILTLTAIGTLALALGINTTLYSAAHAVLFRSPGYGDAERVVFLWNVTQAGQRDSFAPARALDFVERTQSFDGVALIGHLQMTVTGRGAATRWSGASVTANFFEVLAAPAAIGRTFDSARDTGDEVVLSARLWRSEFAGDPHVVGQTVVMNGRARRIAGIMPADFYWPAITAEPGPVNAPLFWTSVRPGGVPERPGPAADDARQNRSTSYIRAVARLRDDVSAEVAQAETRALAATLGLEHPGTDAGRTTVVVPAAEQLFAGVRRPLLLLLMATVAVVLLACLNVANLLLVRLAGRIRELSMRAALGATAWRVVRQFTVEGLLLAGMSGSLGLAASIAGRRALVHFAPETVGRLDDGWVSWPVVGVAAVVSLGTGLLLGLLPAVIARRRRVSAELRLTGAVGAGGRRTRSALVAAQVALSLILLVATALFSQSLLTLRRVEVGLRPEQLLTFDVALTGDRANQPARHFSELIARIRQLPGVTNAAGAVTLPIGGDDFGTRVRIEGQPPPAPGAEPRIGYQVVTPGWFDTLGMRIVDGRDFASGDDGREAVVIVNETFARAMWPDGRAVGRRIQKGRSAGNPYLTVVGTVTDIRHEGPATRPRPEIYEPLPQAAMSFLAVAVRASGDPLALVPSIRAVAFELDPQQPISGVSTMQAHLDRAYGDARFLWALTLTFGVAALVIAGVGIHAVVSMAATQRRRELGVRLALGASPRALVSLVVRQGARPIVYGLVVGMILAGVSSRFLRGLLFETSPLSPIALAAAVAVLFGCAGLALWLPARHAAAFDPVRALRE